MHLSIAIVPLVAALAAAKAAAAPQAAKPKNPTPRATDLLPPVRLEAGGGVIDTDIGHAGPFVGDFDDDGVNDLLVGQFGGGALWIFKNSGTNAAPKLTQGVKWKEGRPEGTVPTG